MRHFTWKLEFVSNILWMIVSHFTTVALFSNVFVKERLILSHKEEHSGFSDIIWYI